MGDDDHEQLAGSGRKRPPPRADRAAFAANWRQILVVDVMVGVLVNTVGIVVLFLVSPVVGAVIAAAGSGYLLLGLARWRRWARLRADAGLDDPGASPPSP